MGWTRRATGMAAGGGERRPGRPPGPRWRNDYDLVASKGPTVVNGSVWTVNRVEVSPRSRRGSESSRQLWLGGCFHHLSIG